MLTLAEPDLALWERFLSGRLDGAEGVAHPVIERWTRARSLGAAPEGLLGSDAILDGDALRERRERVAPFWSDIEELMDGLGRDLASHGYVLLLTDAEGVILSARGGGSFSNHAARVRLVEGARWHEASRGTNAIGTAIAERAAVAVIGRAHFEQVNHGLVCYAAPASDPFGEHTVVLDLTGPVEAADPLAITTVIGAARSLELTLRARGYDTLLAGSRALLERALQRCAQPALLIERPGVVRSANVRARDDLGARSGQTVESLLGARWETIAEAARSGASIRVVPPSQATIAGSRATSSGALTIHAEPLLDPAGRTLAVLAFLDRSPGTVGAKSREIAEDHPAFSAILGDDAALVEGRSRAARFARTPLPILLLAETGTGKELMARAIHAASARARGPFVAINCGAISPSLLESELFGYAAGAFTGARPGGHAGKIAAAEGGTLFLDEVAEMPPTLQAMLLRVLEDGSYSRVGENQVRRASLRLVCATCRDLPADVREGRFRQDLFYRIQGVQIALPPVRARKDLAMLVRGLLARSAAELDAPAPPEVSPEAMAAIAAHAWPGNVRELRSALHHAIVLAEGSPLLLPEHLPADPMKPARPAPPPPSPSGASRFEAEGRALGEALAEAKGNLAAAARRLGVARSTLYRMMERHGQKGA